MTERKRTLLPEHLPCGEPPPKAVLADEARLAHINIYGDLPRYYADYPFVCVDCGSREVWTAEQQKWYYEGAKGRIEAVAVRCRNCRKARKRGNGYSHGRSRQGLKQR